MATIFFFVSLISILFPGCVCIGSDRILAGQTLFPNRTIISEGGMFELGFFNPGNSSNSYVGIWYKNIPEQTVVWVANRNNPISHPLRNHSRLHLSENGTLRLIVLSDKIWDVEALDATEAMIYDTGYFVLQTSQGYVQWASRDYPTDTWLPGGYIGINLFSGLETKLVSWKNPNDPAVGDYSLGMEPDGGSEFFIKYNDSEKQWRSGVLQGGTFSSLSNGSNLSNLYNFTDVSGDESMYFEYSTINQSVVSRIVMTYDGRLINYVWLESTQAWNVLWVQPSDACKRYALCGANAICDTSAFPVCSCLPGFAPQVKKAWDLLDFSDGCRREKPLSCGRDGFRKVSVFRMPAKAQPLGVMSYGTCEFACAENCSCFAYAFSSEGGCSLFRGDLLDLERLPNKSAGRDIYIKMGNAPVSVHQPAEGNKSVLYLALGISFSVVFVLCSMLFCYFWRKRKSKVSQPVADFAHQNLLLLDLNSDGPENNKRPADRTNSPGEDKNSKYELPTYSFSSIVIATNDFSLANKLGQGGFGTVYKGELLNGQFVAVKRLSKRSGQGLEEFKNETELIAKLQHRNLVGILGCCIEYKDINPTKKELLDWGRRAHIIEGIAQGLLYLHQYSRLRIIHRDLKAGNILLDAEMNPKISDFGLARIFGGTDLQANTNRIVGTYGYMSPEYAMEGIFSTKSDVYAFGVLMLEIITGKKNTGFYGSDHLNLLGYAWKLWTNNRGLELIDPALKTHSSSSSIPLRYIQIGLLCVQEHPGDRPTMSDVVAMLNNEQKAVASPKHPVFAVGRTLSKPSSGENEAEMCSVNELTVSLIEAR